MSYRKLSTWSAPPPFLHEPLPLSCMSPSLSLFQVVEGEYVFKVKGHTVFNMSAIKMLFHWLPSLAHPLQLWLSERLHDMCGYGSHNKQRCCIAGVFQTVLRILADSQAGDHAFQQDVESEGTISVTASGDCIVYRSVDRHCGGLGSSLHADRRTEAADWFTTTIREWDIGNLDTIV